MIHFLIIAEIADLFLSLVSFDSSLVVRMVEVGV